MKFNELTKGTQITVQSATTDGGKTQNPDGWWGAYIKHTSTKINNSTLRKIVKTGNYKILSDGYKNGKMISTLATIEII